MYINDKWYSESELAAYVQELQQLLSDCQQLLGKALFVSYSENRAAAEICRKIGVL